MWKTLVSGGGGARATNEKSQNMQCQLQLCVCMPYHYRRVYQIYVTIFPLEHKCIRNAMSGCLAGFVIDSLKHFLFRWLWPYLHGRQRISYARYPLSQSQYIPGFSLVANRFFCFTSLVCASRTRSHMHRIFHSVSLSSCLSQSVFSSFEILHKKDSWDCAMEKKTKQNCSKEKKRIPSKIGVDVRICCCNDVANFRSKVPLIWTVLPFHPLALFTAMKTKNSGKMKMRQKKTETNKTKSLVDNRRCGTRKKTHTPRICIRLNSLSVYDVFFGGTMWCQDNNKLIRNRFDAIFGPISRFTRRLRDAHNVIVNVINLNMIKKDEWGTQFQRFSIAGRTTRCLF